ncbi:MAG: cbb3-type cytochrome c oxidase subunit 3 [Pseudomonadota bacterium]
MYEFLSQLAQTFGLLLFVFAFGLVLYYALSPANRQTFDRASRLPLDEGDRDEQ